MNLVNIFAIFIIVTLIKADGNVSNCNQFQANFNIRKIFGTWYVVAIIPDQMYPGHPEYITCHRVEYSETDVAALRWLVNKTVETLPRKDYLDRIEGIIVRQRYHTIPPFDVWSKSVEGVNGCYQQVLSLDTDKGDINSEKAIHQAMMQLHIVETDNGPFLLQLLWGKMISAVIYRRSQGVTDNQLKPVVEAIKTIRGPQMKAIICDKSLNDLRGLKHK